MKFFGKILLAHERQKFRKHGQDSIPGLLNSREMAMGVERQEEHLFQNFGLSSAG